MYRTLALPELLEAIFAFLSRKDLYRSCARVNHQWNAVSKLIIQKKRKAEFISIPSIRDNIISYLYDDDLSLTEIVNYCKVSDTWSDIFNRLSTRTISLSILYDHKDFLNSSRYSRSQLLHNKKQFLVYFTRRKMQYYLKQDYELNRYYQDVCSLYELRNEFLRLARVFQSYDYDYTVDDEFHRLVKSFQSIRFP